MGVVDRYYGRAGSSGMRRYRLLARDWRRRTFGRRTSLYVWTLWALAVVALLELTPARWRFGEGLVLGMFAAAFLLLPDAAMPDHIARWQRGAWGEQLTAKALKPLRKQSWLIRHDLASGYANGNRDHIAAGPAVYLLDSKLLRDELTLTEAGLHVHRTGVPEADYVIPNLTQRMNAATRALKRDLDAAVGFPVAVYGAYVFWGGTFLAGEQWDGNVVYIDGDRLAEWLASRPVDLHDERKQRAVREWLAALPRA